MRKYLKLLGIIAIIISVATWITEFVDIVDVCAYCHVIRTVIGIVGVLMVLPVHHIITPWLATAIGFLGLHVSAALIFMQFQAGNYINTYTVLSAAAILILVAQLMLIYQHSCCKSAQQT